MSADKDTTCPEFCLEAPAMSREEERKAKKATYDVEYREANKEKRAAYFKAWRKANKERIAETRKKYREANKERLAEAEKLCREANKEDKAEYDKAYREVNRLRIAVNKKEWREANPERHKFLVRRSRLKKEYGLTPEAYDAILESQDHRCAVCRTPLMLLKPRDRHIDHCHKTGLVRGILCHACNKTLGYVNDNSKLLRALARYLERQSKEATQWI